MKSSGRVIYKIISAVSLTAVLGVIFYLSHQTSSESSETSGLIITLLANIFGQTMSQEIVRTVAHLCEFGLLGFLMLNCIYAFTGEKKFFISVVLSWGYAFSDEIHQLFIPGRAFQIIDLVVDLAGILIGCGLMLLILLFFIKKRSVAVRE